MKKKQLLTLMLSTLIMASLSGATYVKAAPKSNNKTTKVTTAKPVAKEETDSKKLTVMMYMDADNNLEGSLLKDIQEMKDGYIDNPNLNLIVLVDRTPGYSADSRVLGEDFTDTRMYKIESGKAIRIDGGDEFSEITTTSNYEANMGDANTLKKFVDSCKSNYKADKYMLLLSNHGGGAKEKDEFKDLNKAICWDDSNNSDCLYMGEISDTLTKDQSVDVLGFDACLMGTAEVAYQYRPGNGGFEANGMIASAPVVWGKGLPYDKIFNRLRNEDGNTGENDDTLGGVEKYFNPSNVTNDQLGALFVEEQKDSVNAAGVNNQQYSYYDLTKIKSVKENVDKLAVNLSEENKKETIEKLRGTLNDTSLIHYFDERDETDWIEYPYFDLYDLCEKISKSNDFSNTTKSLAKDAMESVDETILYSFGQSQFKGFKNSKNGISVFLPDGNAIYTDPKSGMEIPHFRIQRWYNPQDTMALGLKTPYGNLSWCKDGIDTKIDTVGNWFEMLDSWFDNVNGKSGGYNKFRW